MLVFRYAPREKEDFPGRLDGRPDESRAGRRAAATTARGALQCARRSTKSVQALPRPLPRERPRALPLDAMPPADRRPGRLSCGSAGVAKLVIRPDLKSGSHRGRRVRLRPRLDKALIDGDSLRVSLSQEKTKSARVAAKWQRSRPLDGRKGGLGGIGARVGRIAAKSQTRGWSADKRSKTTTRRLPSRREASSPSAPR